MSFGVLKEPHIQNFRSIAPGVKALEGDKESYKGFYILRYADSGIVRSSFNPV